MTDFHVKPLDASFGATVTGLKLADIDEPTFSRLSTPGWSTPAHLPGPAPLQ